MILGIGVDIVNIKRIEKVVNSFGDKFLKRCFSDNEILKYRNKNPLNFISGIAKLFAVKEAFVKALGTGFNLGVTFKNLEVLSDEFGKPFIKVFGYALEQVKKKSLNYENIKYHVSISDDYPTAVAFVVIESY